MIQRKCSPWFNFKFGEGKKLLFLFLLHDPFLEWNSRQSESQLVWNYITIWGRFWNKPKLTDFHQPLKNSNCQELGISWEQIDSAVVWVCRIVLAARSSWLERLFLIHVESPRAQQIFLMFLVRQFLPLHLETMAKAAINIVKSECILDDVVG